MTPTLECISIEKNYQNIHTFNAMHLVLFLFIALLNLNRVSNVVGSCIAWDFDACAKTCGGGTQFAVVKKCPTTNGSTSFVCETVSASCMTHKCKNDWDDWGECSATCGGGERSRSNSTGTTQTIPCNTQSCTVNDGNASCEADVVLVVENSGFITETGYYAMRQLAADILRALPEGFHVGIIVYSGKTTVLQPIAKSTDALLESLMAEPYTGGASSRTAALEALLDLFTSGGRPGVPNKAIFFSDAQPVIRQECMGELMQAVKDAGIEMFVVGTRGLLGVPERQEKWLKSIASEPMDDHIFLASEPGITSTVMTKILEPLCGVSVVSDEDTMYSTSRLMAAALNYSTTFTLTCRPQTPWSECSETCGLSGTRSSDTTCQLDTADGDTVESSTYSLYEECFVECPTEAPPPAQTRTREETTIPSAVSSTESPVPTTKLPVPTTESPVTTTESPVTTPDAGQGGETERITSEEKETTMTASPVTPTESAVSSTESPVSSTESPITTTESPVPTIESPVTTTESPVTTTESPVPTTDAGQGGETERITTEEKETTSTAAEVETTTTVPDVETTSTTTPTPTTTPVDTTTTTCCDTTSSIPGSTAAEVETTTTVPDVETTSTTTPTPTTTPVDTTTTCCDTTTSTPESTAAEVETTTTVPDVETTSTTTPTPTTTPVDTTTTTCCDTTSSTPESTAAEVETTTTVPDVETTSTTTPTPTTTPVDTTTTCCDTTTSTPGVEPDCSRCDYTKGQIWLRDSHDCHKYYICEKITTWGNRWYWTYHHVTCGQLYWDLSRLTCTRTKQPGCDVQPAVIRPPDVNKHAPCSYSTVRDNRRIFKSRVNGMRQTCGDGMEFDDSDDQCACIVLSAIEPNCADELLLHFPYDKHFDDVTCHHAKGYAYGDGKVRIVNDDVRGRVAEFDGASHLQVPFMRNWFKDKHVTGLTVALWFRQNSATDGLVGLVDNGDCIEDATFLIHARQSGQAENIVVGIDTESWHLVVAENTYVADGDWHHVTLVYDVNNVKMYYDTELVSQALTSGVIENRQNPMNVGSYGGSAKKGEDPGYFKGRIDELHIYTRALSMNEIKALAAV
ncbi:hypothetical protein LSAT2_016591 [Lamellibrachia satsuma]|nr:hypothetical protein LSAT2_016591 [Lamellibrachia satsuma]